MKGRIIISAPTPVEDNRSKAGNEQHIALRKGPMDQLRIIPPPFPPRRQRPLRPGDRISSGFTILELIVVLTIWGLVLAMLAPDLRGSLDNIRYKTAARELAATLRYARSQAIATKETHEVRIDAEEGEYALFSRKPEEDIVKEETQGENGSEIEPWEEEGRRGRLPVGLMVEPAEEGYRGHDGDGTLTVRFFPRGSSSGAGILLKGGKVRYRLDVDSVTGMVRISSVEE